MKRVEGEEGEYNTCWTAVDGQDVVLADLVARTAVEVEAVARCAWRGRVGGTRGPHVAQGPAAAVVLLSGYMGGCGAWCESVRVADGCQPVEVGDEVHEVVSLGPVL